MHILRNDFGGDFLYSAEHRNEVVQSVAILVRRDDGCFLVALILNFEKAFWFWRSLVNRLTELEWNYWILCAVDNEKRNAGVL